MAATALVKGCFAKDFSASDWPTDTEEACKQHASFLKLWLPHNLNKPAARSAWKEACPKLTHKDINCIVNKLQEARAWLKKKRRNLKNGDRTDPIVVNLLHSLYAMPGQSQSPQSGQTVPKPAKASNLPLQEKNKQPEEAWTPEKRLKSKTTPVIMVVPREAPEDMQDAISVSSSARTASSVLPVEVLLSKPQPAKGSNVKKKPGMKRPASREKGVWKESLSHGLVKATHAAEKAYIVAKLENGKEKSLVNISLPKGEKQARIVAQLMEKLATEHISKEKLVEFKNQLLKADEPV